MGRKGVSKRKAKKTDSKENTNKGGSSSSVQSLMNVKAAPLNREGANPSNGSNKKNRKGR